ncbi:hypothetical protein ACXXNA_16755 [Bordetella bronchiseptica]|uniref:hypothetical protein n=1 Tax=Bordetella bronchiseptica TaxID=518 RepID=UPI00045952B8|nr:hypothetical protein [Bordetella bronchiseptica]KCV59721.1 hypothetical protein L493_0183 [Bordetella bronchiseptica 99-R-0433]MBN3267519.1 hypothetical protein [Bordetella bronchiseptica]
MNQADFRYHDVTGFPLVVARHRDGVPGFAAHWIAEMEQLAGNPAQFVMIVPDLDVEIAHEDRKAMVQWQTGNMARLRECCKGFIAVKPDPSGLARTQAQAEKMTRAFGLPFCAVATLAQAREKARQLLQTSGD